MNTTTRVLVDVLLRSGALVLADQAYNRVYEAVVPTTGDADIGQGLFELALIVMAVGAWAAWDAWRHDFGRVALSWVVTGFLAAAALTAVGDIGEQGWTLHAILDQLAAVGPFMAGLIGFSALFAGGLVAVTRIGEQRATCRPAE
jgi:hypothetical protein